MVHLNTFILIVIFTLLLCSGCVEGNVPVFYASLSIFVKDPISFFSISQALFARIRPPVINALLQKRSVHHFALLLQGH